MLRGPSPAVPALPHDSGHDGESCVEDEADAASCVLNHELVCVGGAGEQSPRGVRRPC